MLHNICMSAVATSLRVSEPWPVGLLSFFFFCISPLVLFILKVIGSILYGPPSQLLYKSIAGRYRPVRVADGPITARYRFIKNVYWAFDNDSLDRKGDVNVCMHL